MRKIVLFGIAALLLMASLGLAACGTQPAPESSQPSSSQDVSSESEAASASSEAAPEEVVADPAATEAGVFSAREGRPARDASASFDTNTESLNAYLETTFGYRFFQGGIGTDAMNGAEIAQLLQNEDGRMGLHVFGWRTDETADESLVKKLNMVLEALNFICDDRDVALAVWGLVDGVYLNGTANTKDLGFYEIRAEGDVFVFGMNDIEVEWHNEDTYTIWLS